MSNRCTHVWRFRCRHCRRLHFRRSFRLVDDIFQFSSLFASKWRQQWLKWGGPGASAPPLRFEPPAIVWAPWLNLWSVILCPNNAKLVGCGMGMGFVPTWLRQVNGEPPPASHDYFNHWTTSYFSSSNVENYFRFRHCRRKIVHSKHRLHRCSEPILWLAAAASRRQIALMSTWEQQISVRLRRWNCFALCDYNAHTAGWCVRATSK